MNNIIAVIQARMSASRLPGKMMLSLHGKPIIEWVIRRVSSSKRVDGIIVAIPDSRYDDILAKFLTENLRAKIYRGSEPDVLKRFVEAGTLMHASHIVRVCADNPLVSGEVIDELIDFFIKHPCDYAYNQGDGGRTNDYPDGLGAEIVPLDLLMWIDAHAMEIRNREHCLTYITDNPHKFVIRTFNPPDQRLACPWLKLDMDTMEDYRRLAMRKITISSSPYEIVQAFSEDL